MMYVYVSLHVNLCHVSVAAGDHRIHERAGCLGAGVMDCCECLRWVLGPELRACARALYTLNC